MKNTLLYLLVVVLVSSCVEENPIQTYSGPQNIYFTNALSDIGQTIPNSGPDSVAIIFAYYPERADSVIKIPVAATGRTSGQPRKYDVQLAPGSTAEEGVDFDYFEEDFTIPAGSLRDLLQIKLHKTEGLDNDTVRIALKLKANQNFDINMQGPPNNSTEGGNISLVNFNVYSTNVISQPPTWYGDYMGRFSAKKLYLTGEVLGIDLSRWALDNSDTGNVDLREQNYIATALQRYLDKQAANGNTIYEEDGTPIVMGQGVQ